MAIDVQGLHRYFADNFNMTVSVEEMQEYVDAFTYRPRDSDLVALINTAQAIVAYKKELTSLGEKYYNDLMISPVFSRKASVRTLSKDDLIRRIQDSVLSRVIPLIEHQQSLSQRYWYHSTLQERTRCMQIIADTFNAHDYNSSTEQILSCTSSLVPIVSRIIYRMPLDEAQFIQATMAELKEKQSQALEEGVHAVMDPFLQVS